MLQMGIIFSGLILAAFMVVYLLPANVGFIDALHIAGKMNKLNTIDFNFDLNNRYNIWSGIIGGFFLQLSYFGTDQSQVGRYLTGSSITQSRLGLIMNGLVKIPMQFFILMIGALVFTFYQFNQPPIFFNKTEVTKIENSKFKEHFKLINQHYDNISEKKKKLANNLLAAIKNNDNVSVKSTQANLLQNEKLAHKYKKIATDILIYNDPKADVNDTNFVFLTFVTKQLPVGIVGILIAVIFLAAMGSTASGLNSLASTSIVDFYKRIFKQQKSEKFYLNASRLATVGWGIFCIITAFYASKLGNLIEAVNILGSLFYGTILGIFLVAFYMKTIQGKAVFYAALVAEAFIVYAWYVDLTAFLWLNVIGCLLVMVFSFIFQKIFNQKQPQ
jgi:Na+/proline symporter